MSRNVQITFQPLTQWPASRARTPVSQREYGRFMVPGGRDYMNNYVSRKRMPLSRTLDDLDRELNQINARDVVVQVDVENERNFRNDGGIRADARVKSPAIVLSFIRGKVPYVFATDYFKEWEDNLRAIVLGLESLRRLERYHIAQAGDQYRGWTALPSTTTTALSTETAANVLARLSGHDSAQIHKDSSFAKDAYRRASRRSHPDQGGTTTDFQLVQEAKRVLEAHFGGTF